MANTANYVSYVHAPSGSEDFLFYFTITFTGSYVTAETGETVNLLTATDLNGLELSGFLPVGAGDVGFPDILLANFQGYQVILSALTAGTFGVRFFVMDTGAELASGAYPAAITGGQLNVCVRHKG